MMKLSDAFIERGLIQFGWYVRDRVIQPFDTHLQMLPS
jgi:hypothetical protein